MLSQTPVNKEKKIVGYAKSSTRQYEICIYLGAVP